MASDLSEIFKLAAKYFYKEFKNTGGSQKDLAETLGVRKTYLSSVLNGTRSASISLMEQIAQILSDKTLDEFLGIGRRIKEGLEPLQETSRKSESSPESLIAQLSFYVVDHQRIEKELEKKHWLLQEALNVGENGIVIVGSDLKVLAYNKAYKEIIGYPDEILSTRNISAYLRWSRDLYLDQVKFDKDMEEAQTSTKTITHFAKMKDGRKIKRTIYPIYKNSDLAGKIVHIADVTETKRKDNGKK